MDIGLFVLMNMCDLLWLMWCIVLFGVMICFIEIFFLLSVLNMRYVVISFVSDVGLMCLFVLFDVSIVLFVVLMSIYECVFMFGGGIVFGM